VRLLFLLLLVGCSGASAPSEPARIEVTDGLGRVVRLDTAPLRILSLAPGNTEIVFAIGAGDRLVGRTTACNFPAAVEKVPSVGNLFPPDFERILATRPDVALMIDGNLDVRRTLVGRGIPVFVYQPRTLNAAYAGIRNIGQLLGVSHSATALTDQMALRVAAVRKAPKPPRVFYEVWPEPLTTAGPRTFISDVIRAAGGTNIVTDPNSDWPHYPLERLVVEDPDVVVTAHRSTEASAAKRPGWSSLRAVRTGRLLRVPNPDLLARPGPRVVDGVEWLAAQLRK
jgi:iron complex transport system substrate-binding protein